MTLSEAARRTGLTRASARRVLLSLVDLGYAEKEDSRFRLRPRVLDIGYAYLAALGIAHRGQYVLEALTSETREPCSLSVLDPPDIVYVARSTVPKLATMATSIGTRLPAYATAMGVAGGVLTVVFFTVWRQAFGPAHLGQIQGAAQLLTVLASAAGPLVLAAGQRAYGSYAPVVQNLATVSVAFAVAALLVQLPDAERA